MNPEDLGRHFEDALRRIEPRDDAQRERLAKFGEMMRQSNRELAAEIAKIRTEAEELARPISREEIAAQREFEDAARRTMDALADEQNVLLERITAAVRRPV